MILLSGLRYLGSKENEFIFKDGQLIQSFESLIKKFNSIKEDKNKYVIDGSSKENFLLNLMKVDATCDADILHYYNEFGPLNPESLDFEYSRNIDVEPLNNVLENVRRAILYFQNTFNLCNAITNQDISETIKICSQIFRIYNQNPEPEHYFIVEDSLNIKFGYYNERDESGMELFKLLVNNYEKFNDIPFIEYFDVITKNYQKSNEWLNNESNKNIYLNSLKSSFKFDIENSLSINPWHIDIEKKMIQGQVNPKDSTILVFASQIAMEIINTHIYSVHPVINVSTSEVQGLWHANNQLSAIYFEYYLALCEKTIFRKCKNKTCKKYFEIFGRDERKIYCDHTCANTESVRRSRAAKAKKKKEGYKDGNS